MLPCPWWAACTVVDEGSVQWSAAPSVWRLHLLECCLDSASIKWCQSCCRSRRASQKTDENSEYKFQFEGLLLEYLLLCSFSFSLKTNIVWHAAQLSHTTKVKGYSHTFPDAVTITIIFCKLNSSLERFSMVTSFLTWLWGFLAS